MTDREENGGVDDGTEEHRSGPSSAAASRDEIEGLGGTSPDRPGGVSDGQEGPEAGTGREGGQGETPASPPRPAAQRIGYTPLFLSQHEARYQRRDLIREYERQHDCRLVVMIDAIMPESVTFFAELLHQADPEQDLHLMLCSPGGDASVAVRLARMAQAASRKFTVVVPESAKSAATILALGAHEIVMGHASDLGPIDPQIFLPDRGGYYGAKDLIQAVERALDDVAVRPDTYPLHAALLAGIDMTVVQFARSALAATSDIARQALSSHPDRSLEQVEELLSSIHSTLIEGPSLHSAVIGAAEAREAGLPVTELGPTMPRWTEIWALWTRYFAIGPVHDLQVYESAAASQVLSRPVQ